MMDSSREALKPDERGPRDAPAKSQGKLALALGVIAIALSFGSWVCLSDLGPSPGARDGTAQASRRKVSAGWSCGPRSNRRRWLSRLRKRLRTRRQPLNSATWRSRINRTRRRRRNLRSSRPPPRSKRQIKPHSRLRNIGNSERRHLHSCNRLSGKSPKRIAPPWVW